MGETSCLNLFNQEGHLNEVPLSLFACNYEAIKTSAIRLTQSHLIGCKSCQNLHFKYRNDILDEGLLMKVSQILY